MKYLISPCLGTQEFIPYYFKHFVFLLNLWHFGSIYIYVRNHIVLVWYYNSLEYIYDTAWNVIWDGSYKHFTI